MKTALIFGANGFIGSHVTQSLAAAGYQVTAVIRPNVDTTFLDTLNVKLQQLESFTSTNLEKLMQEYDLVYNCIADVTPNKTRSDYNKTQVTLTKLLSNAAHAAGIKRFLQLSTVEVYGNTQSLIDESQPLKPHYPFQQSCVDRETILQKIADTTGLDVVILRPSATFGCRSPFVDTLLSGHNNGRFQIIGKGRNKFSSVDARDIGRAFAFLGQLKTPERVYLLRGYEQNYLEIKQLLDDLTQTTSHLQALPTIIAYVLATVLEIITSKPKIPFLTRFIVSVASSPGLYDDKQLRGEGFETQYSLHDTFKNILANQTTNLEFDARDKNNCYQ